MKKLAVIMLSVAAVAAILFVPIIKNPKDKILTATDNGYEYCGVDYIGSSFNEFSDIDYMNYNDYLYRFDSDSKNFENVYVKKFSSVFERIFGKKYYLDDRGVLVQYNGFISKIGFPGNFCYMRDGLTLPEFKAENIEKITVAKARQVIMTNFEDKDHYFDDAVKDIKEYEEASPPILEITDENTISKFVDEINEKGSTDEFCAELTEREEINDKFYFKVWFKSEDIPFYLSVYTTQNSFDETSYLKSAGFKAIH